MSPFHLYGGSGSSGDSGITVKLLAEEIDFPLVGLTDHYQLPLPASGKTYKHIEINFLYAFGTDPSYDETNNVYVNSNNNGVSTGQFFRNGDERSCWYNGTNYAGYWDAGSLARNDSTTYSIGILRKGFGVTPDVSATLEYNPDTHQLTIANSLDTTPTGNDLPHILSMILIGMEG